MDVTNFQEVPLCFVLAMGVVNAVAFPIVKAGQKAVAVDYTASDMVEDGAAWLLTVANQLEVVQCTAFLMEEENAVRESIVPRQRLVLQNFALLMVVGKDASFPEDVLKQHREVLSCVKHTEEEGGANNLDVPKVRKVQQSTVLGMVEVVDVRSRTVGGAHKEKRNFVSVMAEGAGAMFPIVKSRLKDLPTFAKPTGVEGVVNILDVLNQQGVVGFVSHMEEGSDVNLRDATNQQ